MAEAVGEVSWDTNDEFLHFAFGSFNSKTFTSTGILIRTSDGDRFNNDLSPQMNDKVADIPGGDGQFYFGTHHKSKIININFAFKGLTNEDITNLKKFFSGKEMKELCLSESQDRVYIAKVTSQPTIKYIPFEEEYAELQSEGEQATQVTVVRTIYNGEGSIQFTAYWPYARSKNPTTVSADTNGNFSMTNDGDLPTHFIFTSNGVSSITINKKTIGGSNITYWDSKTGIVKSGNTIIEYTGNGIVNLPVGTISGETTARQNGQIKFYKQYY